MPIVLLAYTVHFLTFHFIRPYIRLLIVAFGKNSIIIIYFMNLNALAMTLETKRAIFLLRNQHSAFVLVKRVCGDFPQKKPTKDQFFWISDNWNYTH